MDKVREKVVKYYQEMACRQPQYSPTRMAELAPGVVAVEDKSGECDALFDAKGWRFTHPELWGEESLLLKAAGLKVLQGVGRAPQVSTIEEMAGFAREHLCPKKRSKWHDSPQFFKA